MTLTTVIINEHTINKGLNMIATLKDISYFEELKSNSVSNPSDILQYKADESYMTRIDGVLHFNFDTYYKALSESTEEWSKIAIRNMVTIEIHHPRHIGIWGTKGTEGFLDNVKNIGKKIVAAVITILKIIIGWIIKFISYIANFIKTNIISKLFPKKDPNEIGRMFKSYGMMGLSMEDNTLDSGASYIPEEVWKELLYMQYNVESYSILERVTQHTAVAVDSIYKSMKLATSKKIFLRVYNAEYGNQEDEERTSKRGFLEFYHERNFMHFIYVIDKLTKGNISSLIVDHPNNDYVLEREIKLNDEKYRGSVVAKAIICNKTIDETYDDIINTQTKTIKSIPMKLFLSEDLLKKLYSQDERYFKAINKEAENTLKTCKSLKDAADEFYKSLAEIQKDLDMEKVAVNYVKIEDAQKWISFLVEFSHTLFNYRINMIKVVKMVMKKLEDKDVEVNSIKPGTCRTRIGNVEAISCDRWKAMSGNDIQKFANNIVKQTLASYFSVNNHPIYIFAFKDARAYDIPYISNKWNVAINPLLCEAPGIDMSNVNQLINVSKSGKIDGNEINISNMLKKYISELKQAFSKIDAVHIKIVGSIILVNADVDNVSDTHNGKKMIELITPSIFFASTILHEVIHTFQTNDINNDLRSYLDIGKGYDDKLTNNNNIPRNVASGFQSYYFHNKEKESFKEQYDFIMSASRNPILQTKLEKLFQKDMGLLFSKEINIYNSFDYDVKKTEDKLRKMNP